MPDPDTATSLAAGALDWLLATAHDSDGGRSWVGSLHSDDPDPTLYHGGSGIALAFLEGHRHFRDDRYGEAALRAARFVAAHVDDWDIDSMHFGLAGMAFALHSVGTTLRDNDLCAAADRAVARLRSRFDGTGWSEFTELISGNAGIALSALAIGDVELAESAVALFPGLAEPTPTGVCWPHRADVESRLYHISHGVLGMSYALASVGDATGRTELLDLALAGVAWVVAADEAGPDGFLVRHSIPQYKPELIEPYSYGWCHGPAGDAQAFRLFGELTGDPAWRSLLDRCWHTVTHSGVPQRLRPGFWDNSGRCCGTAGVLAFACDRQVEQGDGMEFADVLVADLAARATIDEQGVRWSNHEHRVTPSDLRPLPGWAMGNAGIIRELLRYSRIATGRDPMYAVQWPDQPATTDARFGDQLSDQPSDQITGR